MISLRVLYLLLFVVQSVSCRPDPIRLIIDTDAGPSQKGLLTLSAEGLIPELFCRLLCHASRFRI